MIGRRKPRVACREQRLQQLQSPWRTGLYEPVPAEIPRRQIPGVELGQPAHVERDAVLGPAPRRTFPSPTVYSPAFSGMPSSDTFNTSGASDTRFRYPRAASTSTSLSIWSGSILASTYELVR